MSELYSAEYFKLLGEIDKAASFACDMGIDRSGDIKGAFNNLECAPSIATAVKIVRLHEWWRVNGQALHWYSHPKLGVVLGGRWESAAYVYRPHDQLVASMLAVEKEVEPI